VSINAAPAAGKWKLKRNIAPRARYLYVFYNPYSSEYGSVRIKKEKDKLSGYDEMVFLFFIKVVPCVPPITHNKGVLDMF